jgi:hypothetical protein
VILKLLEGCIGLGKGTGLFSKGSVMHVEGPAGEIVEPLPKDQLGITDSRTAIAEMQADMGTADFQLVIQ